MDLIWLSCRVIIGLIFLSSAISKLSNMTEHIVVVRKYQILPPKTVRYFTYLETSIELIASLYILSFLFMIVFSNLSSLVYINNTFNEILRKE